MTITVAVRLNGPLAERLGARRSVTLPDGATADDLVRALRDEARCRSAERRRRRRRPRRRRRHRAGRRRRGGGAGAVRGRLSAGHLPRRAVLLARQLAEAAGVEPSAGARSVTWTTPGARPISIAPVIVARFITSGTDMPSSAPARCRPFCTAAFRSGPVPTTDTGSVSSSVTRLAFAISSARARSSSVSGRARYGRSSATGSSTGPSMPRPFSTSTFSVTVPDTSAVWPAISPSPCIACMSPR